jgi:hypothetical protein
MAKLDELGQLGFGNRPELLALASEIPLRRRGWR